MCEKLLYLVTASLIVFSCSQEDLSLARELAKEKLSDAIQNTDSSSNKPEIGFAKLTFDKAIDSQIAKNCKPLEIDGLFFYYATEFLTPKQIIFRLIPGSLWSLSQDVQGYEKLISPKNYYNYSSWKAKRSKR